MKFTCFYSKNDSVVICVNNSVDNLVRADLL